MKVLKFSVGNFPVGDFPAHRFNADLAEKLDARQGKPVDVGMTEFDVRKKFSLPISWCEEKQYLFLFHRAMPNP